MSITERQRRMITNLDRIVYRKKASGRPGYFFGVEECTTTINSLMVKGMIRASDDRKVLYLTGMVPRA